MVREAPLDSCGPVEGLTAEGSGPCHIHLCDCAVFTHGLAYSSRIVFHRVGAFGFAQHLALVTESQNNTWGIPQKSDFQVLLETRLRCVLSGISQLPLYALPGYDTSNFKSVTRSVWSSDF